MVAEGRAVSRFKVFNTLDEWSWALVWILDDWWTSPTVDSGSWSDGPPRKLLTYAEMGLCAWLRREWHILKVF